MVCSKYMVVMKLIFKINQALAWAVVSEEAWLRGGKHICRWWTWWFRHQYQRLSYFSFLTLKHKPTFSSGVWAQYYWAELSLQGFLSFNESLFKTREVCLCLRLRSTAACSHELEVPGMVWHRLLSERVGLMLLLDLSKHEVQFQLQAHSFKSLWCLICELLCKPMELQPESNKKKIKNWLMLILIVCVVGDCIKLQAAKAAAHFNKNLYLGVVQWLHMHFYFYLLTGISAKRIPSVYWGVWHLLFLQKKGVCYGASERRRLLLSQGVL